MSVLDLFRIGALKRELSAAKDESSSLKARLADSLVLTDVELRERTETLRQGIGALNQQVDARRAELAQIQADITWRGAQIIQLDDEILLQEFGLYKPKYALANSSAYKVRIGAIRDQQADMVRAKTAAVAATNWNVNGDEKEGRRMIADYTKLIVRAFNNECDVTIDGVKFSNLDSSRKRIQKSFDTLGKLGARMTLSLSSAYLALKIQELELCYEYQVKKQDEKEELRRVRERLREEAKLAKEIEEARQVIAKEGKHFRKAKEAMQEQLSRAATEEEKALCQKELAAIEEHLDVVENKLKEVDYREANASAGYVYVISNVGAFGEGVFKIGVTRRLEPMDRIDELSDASVPFDFDVHVLVFSEDAYELESALHDHFDKLRLNRVNSRKEFFRANAHDIEAVLIESFKKPVDFIKLAEAAEYRQSLKLAEALAA
ncbi:MAG: DUF4041 domain-containing protein [Planctomycetota bacterium]